MKRVLAKYKSMCHCFIPVVNKLLESHSHILNFFHILHIIGIVSEILSSKGSLQYTDSNISIICKRLFIIKLSGKEKD